jgi:hypothetical protein
MQYYFNYLIIVIEPQLPSILWALDCATYSKRLHQHLLADENALGEYIKAALFVPHALVGHAIRIVRIGA